MGDISALHPKSQAREFQVVILNAGTLTCEGALLGLTDRGCPSFLLDD